LGAGNRVGRDARRIVVRRARDDARTERAPEPARSSKASSAYLGMLITVARLLDR
jgi:hypothetical protein